MTLPTNLPLEYSGLSNQILFFLRSLVLADASSGTIVRYSLDNETQEVIYQTNDASPKYLAVDSKYQVIYWIAFNNVSKTYFVMKTYFNGSTSKVKSYPNKTNLVDIAIGKDSFYAMDNTKKQIDRFDRQTARFRNSSNLNDIVVELTVVEGE